MTAKVAGFPAGPGANARPGVPIVGQKNTQPQTPMVLVKNHETGQEFLYPAVAVSMIADDVRLSIAAQTAAMVLTELTNRGIIPPPPGMPEGESPAPEEPPQKGKIVTK